MSAPHPKGYIKGPYVIFRRELLEDPELSGVERMVYIAVASYATPDGKAWPSLASIAKRSGFSPRTVVRALDSLEAKGLISRSRRPMVGNRRLTTVYYLGGPPDSKQPAPRPEPPPKPGGNVTPYQRPEEYKSPEGEAALAEMVAKYGGFTGYHQA